MEENNGVSVRVPGFGADNIWRGIVGHIVLASVGGDVVLLYFQEEPLGNSSTVNPSNAKRPCNSPGLTFDGVVVLNRQ